MGRDLVLILSGDLNSKEIQDVKAALMSRHTTIRILSIDDALQSEGIEEAFVLLSDAAYSRRIGELTERSWRLIFLPGASNPRLRHHYTLPSTPEATLKALQKSSAAITHLTYCNGTPLLGSVTLGPIEWLSTKSWREWLDYFVHHIRSLRLLPLELQTSKGQQTEVAALMVTLGDERQRTRECPRYLAGEENLCSRVAATLLAPLSLFGLLKMRISRRKPRPVSSLPPGVGIVRSREILIRSSGTPLPIHREGKREFVDHLRVENRPIEATLLLPDNPPCASGDPDKESLRLQQLPTDKERIAFYTRRTLPLVPLASEERFARLLGSLKEAAAAPFSYWLLLILSVLMATTGLFQNAAPTIIGAMILAPLMGPIISLSMGVLRFDTILLRFSGRTLILSLITALLTSALLAWFLPFGHVTEQIAMRTHPTLLDLAVAILSGIAAAYGFSDSKVGQSLAGVAIAVALVPPLSVAGIGIGWGSWELFSGAFLLFLANFAGIILAAGATFYLLGYSSWRTASGALSLKLLLLLLIAVPLALSTRSLIRDERIYRAFQNLDTLQVEGRRYTVELQKIRHRGEKVILEVAVIHNKLPDARQREKILRHLAQRLSDLPEISLLLSYRQLYEGKGDKEEMESSNSKE